MGEHEHGKSILDRAATDATPLTQGVKRALISMDSTLRSNSGEGMPLDRDNSSMPWKPTA